MRKIGVCAAVCFFFAVSGVSFADVTVNAYLYNPKTDSAVFTYPYPHTNDTSVFSPYLMLTGTGVVDGKCLINYSIECGETVCLRDSLVVVVKNNVFAHEVKLDKRYPAAKQVRWEVKTSGAAPVSGVAALTWSRFHGRVVFRDSLKKSDAYINLLSLGFSDPGFIKIPVGEDGSFDEMVPARVYRVMNVNSMGYSYNAMERWAWDYDLTHDREDEFIIGRTEIYSMRAFEVIGGPRTLFVAFRPTALSRVLGFDTNGDGLVEGSERKAMSNALRSSCTAIGPELTADNIKLWIDGERYPVVHLTQVPEYDGDGRYQVQYLLQIYPGERLHGTSHEIKVEVESEEELNGKKILDWGQGSVGYYPWGYRQGLF